MKLHKLVARSIAIMLITGLALLLANPLTIYFGTPKIIANLLTLAIGAGLLDAIGIFKHLEK